MESLTILIDTLIFRPYVFIFFAFYLTIAIINMGLLRSIVFTFIAYGIAFLSEYSSTRNGFPYGMYSYIETTRNQELWITNIPFMDSLSFSFLAYIGYTMSLLIWSSLQINGWDIRLIEDKALQRSWRVVVTGAILFMLMDVVIDPVAFRGDRWFLGKIYRYAEAGEYFSIPLTNFGGWLLVGFTILTLFARLDTIWEQFSRRGDVGPFEVPGKALWGPGLYFGVLGFNLTMTFYIEEYILGFCGTVLTAVIFSLLLIKIRIA